jgi:hypothetical protein
MSVRKRSTARAAIIVLFTFIYWTCVASRSLAESDWDIARVAGFPVFAFNTTTSNSEVVFKYSVTGTNCKFRLPCSRVHITTQPCPISFFAVQPQILVAKSF